MGFYVPPKEMSQIINEHNIRLNTSQNLRKKGCQNFTFCDVELVTKSAKNR